MNVMKEIIEIQLKNVEKIAKEKNLKIIGHTVNPEAKKGIISMFSTFYFDKPINIGDNK